VKPIHRIDIHFEIAHRRAICFRLIAHIDEVIEFVS